MTRSIWTPGKNSWATGGSASRTKVEIFPLLEPFLTGSSGELTKSAVQGPRIILELAAGFGEHVVYFASQASSDSVEFQPTEAQQECISGISRQIAESTDILKNRIRTPLELNVLSEDHWNSVLKVAGKPYNGIYLFNMLHISPWDSTVSLFRNAAKYAYTPASAFLAVYGAFKRNGEFTSEGDRLFDLDLKRRDQSWGIRDLESEIIPEAEKNGFVLKVCHMAASNNLFLVWTLY
ncbi:uncharacterized protein V1516DRAFT_617268 [Lipomyces oligophaga]|uniref:uncharacterized protein n=1 Tax=Lipomyces oligophaga TaxID=45792 RepID=UPI0034CEF942